MGSVFGRWFGGRAASLPAAQAPPPSLFEAVPAAPSSRPLPPISLSDPASAARTPPPRVAPARASYHHLRTGRGNLLTAGTDRVAMADNPAPGEALIAMIPDPNRQICFLMAADLRPIAVQADGLRGPVISAFRLQTADPALLRLRHPLAPMRFMAVTPQGHGAPDGCVIFDSLGRTRLDLFESLPIDPASLSANTLDMAAELCAAAARPFGAVRLLDQLRSAAIRPSLAETLIRVLPREELARLAAGLLDNPADLALLVEIMPDNPWTRRVLPALAAWRRDRGPVGPGNVMSSPASDEFAGDPLEGYGQPQAGFALTGLARARVAPRHGACLLAAARNEGPYLLEWLAYHQAVGFEHAFIYCNDNWDGSDALLAALAAAGVITVIQNQPGTHCGPQYKAYSHALSLLPQILDYAWTAVLDLDEFFAFDSGMFSGIEDYLAWHQTQPVDAIALCWQVFVGKRADLWRDEATLTRFTRREAHPNAHVKSIFRPHLFWHAQAHFPQATLNGQFVFRAETGALHHHAGEQKRIAAFAEAPSAQIAWINHYLLRSAPEALWKMARGHGDWKGNIPERQLEMARFVCRTFVSLADKTDLVEDRRILTCAPGRDAALAALRALPGVAEAEDRIKASFASRITRMTKAFVETPAQPGEPGEFAPFRDLLRALPLDLM